MSDIQAAADRLKYAYAGNETPQWIDIMIVCREALSAARLAESGKEPPGDLVDYRPIPRENSVRGIGRTEDSRTVILVSFDEEPTASEMRSFHEYVRSWRL